MEEYIWVKKEMSERRQGKKSQGNRKRERKENRENMRMIKKCVRNKKQTRIK